MRDMRGLRVRVAFFSLLRRRSVVQLAASDMRTLSRCAFAAPSRQRNIGCRSRRVVGRGVTPEVANVAPQKESPLHFRFPPVT